MKQAAQTTKMEDSVNDKVHLLRDNCLNTKVHLL